MLFGPGYIQRAMFVFVICTILSLLIDGLWLGATDYGTMRILTYFWGKGYGGWVIPLTAVTFIASLPDMIAWDYSFFASLGAFGGLLRLILFVTISIGFTWGFLTMLLPIVANFFVTVVKGLFGMIGRFI